MATNKRLVRNMINRQENSQAQAASENTGKAKPVSFEDVLRLCEKPNNGELRSKVVRSEFAKKLGIRVADIVGLQRQIAKLKGLRLKFPQLGRRPNITLIG